MSGEKFASLTANLLVRKGEAAPSAIMPSDLLAFPRPPERGVSQRAREVSHRSDHTQKARGITVTLPPAESETIGFIAVKKGVTRSQLLRLALEGCGDEVIVPVEVDPNRDGSVMLTISDSTEKFTHDAGAGGWVGNGGSFLTGDPDLFSEADGWCITISLHENERPSVEICHDNQREALKLDGFPAAMFA